MKKMCFLYNGQAYQQKTEKFSVSEEKKFGKIDSRKQRKSINLSINKRKPANDDFGYIGLQFLMETLLV